MRSCMAVASGAVADVIAIDEPSAQTMMLSGVGIPSHQTALLFTDSHNAPLCDCYSGLRDGSANT